MNSVDMQEDPMALWLLNPYFNNSSFQKAQKHIKFPIIFILGSNSAVYLTDFPNFELQLRE